MIYILMRINCDGCECWTSIVKVFSTEESAIEAQLMRESAETNGDVSYEVESWIINP